MRRLRCVSALVPLLAAPIACGRAHDGVETRQAELDFETGNVKGTISWKGNPLDASEARDLYLFESGSVSTWTNDTSYLLEGVPEGTRTVGLYVNSCTGDPSAKIGETTFSLAPGATITSNFDLTTTAGRVTLTLLGNTVLDARLDIQGQVCTHTTYADEQGSFSRLLAPGSYRAELHSATVVFRSFTFNVDAGQTTDLGPIEIVGGNAQGAILWNKEPIAARDAIDLYLYEPESVSAWTSQPSYTLRELSPGTHVVELHVDSCIGFASSKIGEVTFDASPATNVTADFDLTSTAGRLNGSILSGGIAPANARVEIRATGCTNVAYVDSAGGFSRLLAPGAYWAEVHSFAGIIDSFPFLIEAGKTTEMGTIDVPTGDVQGTIRWKGNELDEGEARDLFLYESGAVSGWTSSATYELHGLLPGPHALGLYVDSCTGYTSAKLGQSSFGVVAGTTIAADFDLTSTAGQLTGSIRTNGAPFAYARLRIQPSEGCSHMVYADGDGQFSRILSPGSFTGEVFGPAGIIGSFGFAIHAGQTTNVDNFTTPPGKKVQTDLAGGVTAVGGLSLEFAFVKTGGSTSIVTSGSGPPPAPGYQVLGFKGDPMYWDLTTTARYEGAITVCIHYDETGITGNEMLLELHHDDGTGFKKVRNMELDAEADIVCGETDSLSPFVIVEPIAGTNTPPVVSVPANLSFEASGPAGAAATFTATASDAEDGSPATVCTPASGSTFAVGTTPVNCTAIDSGGLSASASFTVTVTDTAGPAFAAFPATIVAYATSRSGAVVSYQSPTASDKVSGPRPVTCTPASGTKFPLGKSPVNCTAVDTSGNPSSASFTVWVQVQAPADGTFFQKPIRPDGSSVFRVGRAVPVKFQLTGASAAITDLVAKLIVTRTSDRVSGTADCEGDEDGEDTDMLFKYRKLKGLYGYRWKTRGESAGTYRLRADLGDDLIHETTVSLKVPR